VAGGGQAIIYPHWKRAALKHYTREELISLLGEPTHKLPIPPDPRILHFNCRADDPIFPECVALRAEDGTFVLFSCARHKNLGIRPDDHDAQSIALRRHG